MNLSALVSAMGPTAQVCVCIQQTGLRNNTRLSVNLSAFCVLVSLYMCAFIYVFVFILQMSGTLVLVFQL